MINFSYEIEEIEKKIVKREICLDEKQLFFKSYNKYWNNCYTWFLEKINWIWLWSYMKFIITINEYNNSIQVEKVSSFENHLPDFYKSNTNIHRLERESFIDKLNFFQKFYLNDFEEHEKMRII